MTGVKARLSIVVMVSSLLSSTGAPAAADSVLPSRGGAAQEGFRRSMTQAIAAVASAREASVRRDRTQDPVDPPRSRTSQRCSYGIPAWLKYALVGAAAAGGGYAVSQIDHHGGHGPQASDGLQR